mgnify:CR=1 FL=1
MYLRMESSIPLIKLLANDSNAARMMMRGVYDYDLEEKYGSQLYVLGSEFCTMVNR